MKLNYRKSINEDAEKDANIDAKLPWEDAKVKECKYFFLKM